MGSWTLNIVLIRHFRGQVMLAAGLLFLLVPMYVLGADPVTPSITRVGTTFCPNRITRERDLQKNPLCCFFPSLLALGPGDICCQKYNICNKKKPAAGGDCVSIPFSRLTYCLDKITGKNWYKTYPQCCVHPVTWYRTQAIVPECIQMNNKNVLGLTTQYNTNVGPA